VEKRGSITQVEIFGQTYNVRAERLIRKLDDALGA